MIKMYINNEKLEFSGSKNTEKGLSKKQKRFLFIFIGFFVSSSLFLLIPSVEGWGNGSTPTGGWATYSYDLHFGTHDWVADFALQEIENIGPLYQKWDYNNGQDNFWTKARKKIYLYATEGPDNGNIYYRSGLRYFRGEHDPARHHIYFWDSEKIRKPPHSSSLYAHDQAHNMAMAAVSALNDGECEIAAFYLGQMTHYIADLSNFGHVLLTSQLVDCEIEFSTYETRVNRYTYYVKEADQGYTGFFSVESGITSRFLTKDPSELAIYTAKKNRFGNEYHYSAKKFDQEYNRIDGYLNWLPQKRDGSSKDLFDTIEWNLNNAIDACAAALDWVIDTANFEGCKSNEEDYARIYDQIVKDYGKNVANNFTKLMIWLGQWAVVYAGGAETFKEVSKKIPIPT